MFQATHDAPIDRPLRHRPTIQVQPEALVAPSTCGATTGKMARMFAPTHEADLVHAVDSPPCNQLQALPDQLWADVWAGGRATKEKP